MRGSLSLIVAACVVLAVTALATRCALAQGAVPGPGPAPAAAGCPTFADFQVAAHQDGAVMLADLHGADARAFVAGLGRFGAVRDMGAYDEVAAFWVPGAPAAFVVILRADCIVGAQRLPQPIVALVLGELS